MNKTFSIFQLITPGITAISVGSTTVATGMHIPASSVYCYVIEVARGFSSIEAAENHMNTIPSNGMTQLIILPVYNR